jgi:hypothetical protein
MFYSGMIPILIDCLDRHASLKTRSKRSHQTPTLRDLDRLALPHSLMPRHASQHLPSSLHLTGIRNQRHSPLRLRLSRRRSPPQLTGRISRHERHERSKQQHKRTTSSVGKTHTSAPTHRPSEWRTTHCKRQTTPKTNAHPPRPFVQPTRFRGRSSTTTPHDASSPVRQHCFSHERPLGLLCPLE